MYVRISPTKVVAVGGHSHLEYLKSIDEKTAKVKPRAKPTKVKPTAKE